MLNGGWRETNFGAEELEGRRQKNPNNYNPHVQGVERGEKEDRSKSKHQRLTAEKTAKAPVSCARERRPTKHIINNY